MSRDVGGEGRRAEIKILYAHTDAKDMRIVIADVVMETQ